MKSCVLIGDMNADKTAEQYPLANVCEECIKEYKGIENSRILHIEGEYDPAYGNECAICETQLTEEE